MTYCVVCPECGYSQTFYTLNEPKDDYFCNNCGSIVSLPTNCGDPVKVEKKPE